MASNLIAMASNLLAMASNLRAMASNLRAMASTLVAMASNLIKSDGLQQYSASKIIKGLLTFDESTPCDLVMFDESTKSSNLCPVRLPHLTARSAHREQDGTLSRGGAVEKG